MADDIGLHSGGILAGRQGQGAWISGEMLGMLLTVVIYSPHYQKLQQRHHRPGMDSKQHLMNGVRTRNARVPDTK